jgi:DNA-binding transcriptional regulator GbsR (MarR family)
MPELSSAVKKFIVHWGEMGERWGINRTVAQIQALLYVSPEPLNAEQISQTLSVARSTVSVGLHELQYWGIVNVSHRLGDRTDYYELTSDVWEMFRLIADRRIQKEIDPIVLMLRETVGEFGDKPANPYEKEKLEELLDVLDTATEIYSEVKNIPTKTIVRIAKMSDIVGRILRLVQE